MNKPANYDGTQTSAYTPIELGGHVCVIKQVSETTSKNGSPMIVVLFDFDASDKQHGQISVDFNADVREDKKWPFLGTCWIMVNDFNDQNTTSRKFKTFCVCAEKSNPGFTIQWGGENWGKQFVGKKIGAVYGEEENEYNGESRMRTRLKWFCGVEEAKTAKIPAPKMLKQTNSALAPAVQIPMPVEINDNDIPF